MKVLVTGATGFTGSSVVPMLLERGTEVRCLARPTSNRDLLPVKDVEWVEGNVEDPASVERALQDVDTLINVVSIGAGKGPLIVEGARAAGVKRAVFISTTSLFTKLNAQSKALRVVAEESIQESGMDYTILRPTMIYGTPRDRNMTRLVRFLQKSPVIPIFGSGEFLQQPVYVGDVARAVVDCLNNDHTIGKAYNIAGAAPLTYNEVIDTTSRLMGRRVMKLHIPAAPVLWGMKLAERLKIRLPIKSEQVLRLNEHKNFDYDEAARDFGYSPLSFEQGMTLQLQEMGLLRA